MSRRTITIIIIVFISLILGGFIGFYFYIHNKSPNSNIFTHKNGFFGFLGGTNNSNTSTGTTNTSTSTTQTQNIPIPRLRHLTLVPVAGEDFVVKNILATSTTDTSSSTSKKQSKTLGTTEVMRWIERGTGNIFETSSSTFQTDRLSNTTLTKIYEAFFSNTGNSLVLRGIQENIDAIWSEFAQLTAISPTSTDQTLQTKNLPMNMTELTLSPDKTKYVAVSKDGVRVTIANVDGSGSLNLFDSPFQEWLVDWPLTNTVVLNTKPSGTALGYAYSVNTKTKAFTKLLGDRYGLTTLLSQDGTKILFGESKDNSTVLGIYDEKNKAAYDFFLKTFPEKCVWSKLNTDILYCAIPANIPYDIYPDAWYQGRIHFSDTLWMFNLKTGEQRQILVPSDYTDYPLDMIKLSLDAKEDYLMFQDKNDLSLWGFQLTPPAQVLQTDVSSSTKS